MQGIHGGDIYRNKVNLDFSVNINPLGMPERVETALHAAVASCQQYPDIRSSELHRAVSDMLEVSENYLLFGNGASELFMGIVHGLRPKKILLPIPSFYGYEYAAKSGGSEVIYFPLKEEKDFQPDEDLWNVLTDEIDILFFANPNNPTGQLVSREYLERLLQICREKNIYVVLDECFIEFCEGKVSMLSKIEKYRNLILVRAFTKIYAIPGVRLGYLVCSDELVLEKIRRQLPEWNISVLAQVAGAACAGNSSYIEDSIKLVKRERTYLEKGLRELGLRVFHGEANFVLVYSAEPLYEKLLNQGILIRDCENFRGLAKCFYRIAVKSRQENEILLKVIGECIGGNGTFD
ncbi:MAG: aminotransferase class I/II-fold pyridoxal phosphate-dependent enzyme [Lachnospiraceae bacterium]|nr:aminotransferase class I/II-fold pyridoxal phosphate-dependent enzyme [Lachnospiraceae bacterium]